MTAAAACAASLDGGGCMRCLACCCLEGVGFDAKPSGVVGLVRLKAPPHILPPPACLVCPPPPLPPPPPPRRRRSHHAGPLAPRVGLYVHLSHGGGALGPRPRPRFTMTCALCGCCGTAPGWWSRQHRPPLFVAMYHKTCAFAEGCCTIASYAPKGHPHPMFCASHKNAGDVLVYRQECRAAGCRLRAVYADAGSALKTHCPRHRLPQQVNAAIASRRTCRRRHHVTHAGGGSLLRRLRPGARWRDRQGGGSRHGGLSCVTCTCR